MKNTITKDQYITLTAAWSEFSRSKNNTAADHIIYNALRGKPIDTGFKPITNPLKISAFADDPYFAFKEAKRNVLWQLSDNGFKHHKERLARAFGLDLTDYLTTLRSEIEGGK